MVGDLQTIQILRATDNEPEAASIVELTTAMAQQKIDRVWWHEANLSMAVRQEGDAHWEWAKIVNNYSHSDLRACVAILSQAEYLEGALAYRFDAKSKIEADAGSVYVGWLATAPRNRSWLAPRPIYKGIGTVLLYWAVRESYLAGLGGRISLQSLPTSSTVRFYEHKGFVRTDRSQPVTGLIDYELPQSAAIAWLKKEGDLA